VNVSVLVLEIVRSDSASIDPPRYEPLPGLAALPAWAWRRAGRGVRIGAVLVLLGVIAAAVAVAPALRDAAREQDDALQRERAEQRAELVRRLEAEQRPVHDRSRSVAPAAAGADERLSARAGLMDDLAATIEADARARVRRGDLEGRIRRVECEPFPRTVDGIGAEQHLERRRGRYSCLAITSEFTGGVIGHQYRALVDFESGRFAYCKISGQSGPDREQLVTTPRACGG
jgi:hypothetical protein